MLGTGAGLRTAQNKSVVSNYHPMPLLTENKMLCNRNMLGTGRYRFENSTPDKHHLYKASNAPTNWKY